MATLQDRVSSSVNDSGTCASGDTPLTQPRSADVHGWQPIETAPKDTNVLLAWRYEGVWEIKSGWAGSTRGGWLDGQATHWMLLPEPPR